MKKCIIFILLCSIILSGCGSVYSNYKEIEQLLVIDTMGFDYVPGGVELSMAAGIGPGGAREPIRLSGIGSSISSAMDDARNYSFEDELFCSQTSSILIGEEAAKNGIEGVLSYICQSPILRTDLPVFIVKGSSAKESIMNSGDSQHGVAEILQGVSEYLETRGGSHIFKASQLVRSNLRYGSALACVLEYSDSAEAPAGSAPNQKNEEQDSAAKTLAVAGFGVLKDNVLLAYIDSRQAVGLSFLINKVGVSTVELEDGFGQEVVLEISGGSGDIEPVWDADGAPKKLNIKVDVKAAVAELKSGGDLSEEAYINALSAALEKYIAGQIRDILRLSAKLEADFLALGAAVEQASPLMFRHMDFPFAQYLSSLEFSVAVSARLSHTNDMKESLT